MKQLQADVVVIGGGTAGMGAFRNARFHTDNVYLIEGHAFGTTCARVGCMPSKLLIAAAEARHHALHTDPFGIHLDKNSITVNGAEVMNRVKSERDRFVGFVVSDVEEWPADKRIMGNARFIDEHTVQIDDHTQIKADRIVIATGSRPVIQPQWEALGDKLIINDDVFSWDTLPESVAVFGPGVIGLELGQALHRLGVKTEIFGVGGSLGGITDPVVLAEAKAIFSEELPLHLDVDPEKTEVKLNQEGKVEVHWVCGGERGVYTADYLLAAIGRRPNVDKIGLENLNIELDERGVPKAHPLTMQTSIPHIFIAGDASNQLPLLHEASDQGKIAGDNAGLYPNIANGLRRSPLGVVFTNPQIAIVGLRYARVFERYKNPECVAIGEVSFRNQGRSRVMLVNKGHMRVYAEQGTGLFIGAEIVGPAAEHLAHLLAWAHQQKMTVPKMLDMPFYHPVIEEGLRTALRDVNSKLKLGEVHTECAECPGA
ncbi:dihydrolipoyl dehydrogenase [Neisseria dentiae]|uniref:Dihydrolipoyl dehydrogenase n=1 Tax=Neisseria dentiae TaxID=194197 RepID=A0A1X3DF23_9NEIS|nr:dihydrolipoyl dehydrogenase [Neisseria dentiae]OSI18480.1 dihydrolipoyl dehydrogenase [Neisseria dentiae]QMT45633.1 dihydrolipoyl dehydrogenase [Neisseria dentiae]STZ51555.1 dihydrolipoamide dehydrogenase [Neisseria dentiae]